MDHSSPSDPCPQETGTASTPQIPISVITAIKPKRLSKQLYLKDGQIDKSGGGVLAEGQVKVVQVDNLEGFKELLPALGTDQALVYGLPSISPARVVSKEEYARRGEPNDMITRTKDHFGWNDGPGILMLDYDPHPGTSSLSREELVSILREAVPGLSDVQMLWWASASSFITNVETGEQLAEQKGQRLYIPVMNAADIPRAGEAIIEYLWAAGYGHYAVSKAGSLLSRTVFDSTVWQANRLDFAAGAICVPPLVQNRGMPLMIDGAVYLADTRTLIPSPSTEFQAVGDAERKSEKRKVETEAKKVQEKWIEDRVSQMTEPNADEEAIDLARATAKRAIKYRVLNGDFTITLLANAKRQEVTVGDVLDEPAKHHGQLTLDPLEPDYQNHKPVGKLYVMGARPRLHSFAHGGRTYKLVRQLAEIELVRGRSREATDTTLEIMRLQPDIFDFGGALVVVEQGRVFPLDDAGLAHYLGGVTQYWCWRKLRDGGLVKVLEDPAPKVVKQMLSLGPRRKLKLLTAVITAPTLRPDGTVLDKPGYDETTGILYEVDENAVSVPQEPDLRQASDALQRLLIPFKDFPIVDAPSKGILLSAILTAAVRPALTTSPAFGFDAPVQASGKTLLANCIAVLVSGEMPTVWPHTAGRDDEEVRKRLFTALRNGSRALVWDNIVGTFDSPAMAAALTSGNFTDRVLGKSESVSVPNRAVMLMTGNNLVLAGDMARRVLCCRIDPRTDRPFARQFDLDPLQYVFEHRVEMIVDALTLVRANMTINKCQADGRMASFEAWDDYVRQTVCWIGNDLQPGGFGDPMESVISKQINDPEQETLGEFLEAFLTLFRNDTVTSTEILNRIKAYADPYAGPSAPVQNLRDCLNEFNPRATESSRSLGKVLKYRLGRVVRGLRLETVLDTQTNTNRWKVVKI